MLSIGLAALACAIVAHHWAHMSPHDRHDFHPLEANLVGVQIAQLAIGVLGVLVITGEYSTGMIRATMTAVPKRLPVLWGKAIVYGAVVLALTIPTVLIAFVVGQSILARHHINIAFTHPGVARVVFGAALYLTVIGLFGLGIGAIVRNTAGGHRHLRRDPLRAAAADERPADELEQRRLALPAAERRPVDHGAHPRRATSSRRGPASGCSPPTRPSRCSSRRCCCTAATPNPARARPRFPTGQPAARSRDDPVG